MKSSNELLKNRSFEELQKAFKEVEGISLISEKEAKESKDLGFIVVPNTTQIPNEIFDKLMPLLGEAELKIVFYIARKTFGFGKPFGDKIPLSQIMEGTLKKNGERLDFGTGLKKGACLRAIAKLESLGILTVKRSRAEDGTKKTNHYILNVRNDYN